MHVVHVSDIHGSFVKLPEADLYVITGDILPNFTSISRGNYFSIESMRQREYVANFVAAGGWGRYLDPETPIFCVRGNHDFIPLSQMFEGVSLWHEFIENEVIDFGKIKVTGHRGVPFINGFWSDERSRESLIEVVRDMPSADIYLTHYPPYGVLDDAGDPGSSFFLGLSEMKEIMMEKHAHDFRSGVGNPIHCFGHIHEEGGRIVSHTSENGVIMRFSNAAQTINEFDI